MEKKTAGLIGAIASLAAMGSAQAAVNHGAEVARTMDVSSYRELLKPIPNAAELLKASNAELLSQARVQARPVQYYQEEPPPPPPYYHHHHHHYYPPPPPPVYHHHHHHHHSGVTIVVPGVGVLHSGN